MNHIEAKKLQERIAMGEDQKALMREYQLDYKSMRYHVNKAFLVSPKAKKVRRISVSAVQSILANEGFQRCADHFKISVGLVDKIAKHTGKYYDFRQTDKKEKPVNVVKIAPEIKLKMEVESAEIQRCEWCKHERQPCLNCWSLAVADRLPFLEDFQYIEKKITI